MRVPFERSYNDLIYLTGIIFRGKVDAQVPFILDTGATRTIIAPEYLKAIGYDLKNDTLPTESIVTGGGMTQAPLLILEKLIVLGQVKTDFPVYVLSFPRQSLVSGIIGNDFLKAYCLTIHFPEGWLSIA
jgi:predicted aspartyl protease